MAGMLFRGKKGANPLHTSPASTSTSTSMLYHHLLDDRQGPGEQDRHLRGEQALSWVPAPLSKNKTHLQKSMWNSGKSSDTASPAASTRYLLDHGDDDAFFDVFQELDQLPAWIPIDPDRFRSAAGDDSAALMPPAAAAASAAKERDQVLLGASSSSSYLPSTRLIRIEKGDGSPVLWPSTASLPSATLQTARGESSAVIEQSSFGTAEEQAFFGGSSSSSSSLQARFHATENGNSAVLKPPSSSSSSSSSARTLDQVVVLRVSLHCKGCEAKVRKHISRMKGVASFNIDYDTKKVTVIGDVTPLGVLSSVSKVKSAQFWTSPPRLPSHSR